MSAFLHKTWRTPGSKRTERMNALSSSWQLAVAVACAVVTAAAVAMGLIVLAVMVW